MSIKYIHTCRFIHWLNPGSHQTSKFNSIQFKTIKIKWNRFKDLIDISHRQLDVDLHYLYQMLIFVAAFEILTNIDVCRIEYFFMPLQLICEISSREQIFSEQALNIMIILWINWTIQKSWNHFFFFLKINIV